MEEFKKKGYYPAGGRSQTSSAGSITYKNNSTYPFTNAGNVQDAIDNIYDIIEGTAFDFDTNTSTDYIKDNPDGTQKKAKVVMIDGRSLVLNQLVNNESITIPAGTYGYTKGADNIYFITNHKYFLFVDNTELTVRFRETGTDYVGTESTKQICLWGGTTGSSDTRLIQINGTSTLDSHLNCIDLTQMFGAGNEPTTVDEVEAIIGIDYLEYNAGEIINAPLQEIVSKDSSDVVIDNYVIPDDVKDLPLYGAGVGTAPNTLAVSDREYIQRIDTNIDLSKLNWSRIGTSNMFVADLDTNGKFYNDSSIPPILNTKYTSASSDTMYYNRLTTTTDKVISINNTWISASVQKVVIVDSEYTDAEEFALSLNEVSLLYELQTPVVADLSDIITEDYIEVADGGTLEFVSNEDYNIPVQNTEIYMVKL